MTDEMMALQGLLEKTSDADLVREMLGFAAERLPPWSPGPGCFAGGLGGAAARRGSSTSAARRAPHGAKSPDRLAQRNGYRDRVWETRAGTIELVIPKLRPAAVS